MKVEFTGRHTEVPQEIRELAARKLKKLEKVLPGITWVHVIVASDRHRQVVEVSIHSRNLDLTAAEETGDAAVSLATVMDKLTRQAQRHLGKLRERNRRSPTRRTPARSTAIWAGITAGAPGDGVPRVVRTRRFVAKPMTVEEAALEVGASDNGFLVFRDAATERVNVLYKRKDGNLGLIEPGA